MTKEEILEKSRNENQNHDIYDLEVQNIASRFAIFTTCILCCVLTVAVGIITKKVPFEFLMILFGMESTLFTVKFVKMHKKHELVVAICYVVGFLVTASAFVLKTIGIF